MSFKNFLFLIILIFNCFTYSYAQNLHPTNVRGLITDSVSKDPLPLVYISFVNSNITAMANDEGVFSIETTDTSSYLKITLLGYETKIMHLETGKHLFLHIKLNPESKKLAEVIITHKRKRYKNSGNPAVKIIDEVIDHKSQNRVENIDYLDYDKYQKLLVSIDRLTEKLEDNPLLKPFRFVFENIDSTIVPGRMLLPVYIKEDISHYYYRKKPVFTQEIFSAEKLVSFDEYVNRKTLNTAINYLYQDINIYDNNIALFSNQFLSPIATIAPSFYKYFITDTVYLDSIKCVKLAFAPRNKGDFLFQGYIFVNMDSSFAIKKISMQINKDINLNWVKGITIDQEFQKYGSGWLLSKNDMNADFAISESMFGIYGQKTNTYKNYNVNKPQNDNIYKNVSQNLTDDQKIKSEEYWTENRPHKLRPSEQNVYILMDSLRQLPAFKRDMDIMTLLTLGFQRVGPFEIGPTSTVYSQNPIEGARIRLGIRSTKKFSKKLFFETYGAYGFKDKVFKSNVNVVYSLNDKYMREFPTKSVGVNFQNDMEIPGQDLEYAQSDNIILSIKRGLNDKMYLKKHYNIEYINEFENHFSYKIGYEYSEKKAVGNLYFNTKNYSDYYNEKNQINVSQLSIDLRFSPHEKFVLGSMYRINFPNVYPVTEIKLITGSKLIGSDYNFWKVQANITKRFNLSLLGYTDVELEAGKLFGHVVYPLLTVHRANQTYAYQPLSYNLMNFLEFISDQYISLNVDHNFNGFFLNRVPLIKHLKFREAVTFKMLYGSLSNNNNPSFHADLFKLPTDIYGSPISFTLEKKPYVEVGCAITNIFRFFRIDFVERVSYINHPNISKWGIRADYKFDF